MEDDEEDSTAGEANRIPAVDGVEIAGNEDVDVDGVGWNSDLKMLTICDQFCPGAVAEG